MQPRRAEHMEPDPTRPILPPAAVIGLGILAVSTGSIFVRFAQATTPSLVVAACRLGLATVFLAPLALSRHLPEIRQVRGSDRRLVIASGVFLALHFATWITSLEYTTVASSVVLVSTSPLWVALLSPLVLKESLTRTILLGMGLALFGGFVVGISDSCLIESGGLVCPPVGEFIRGKAFFGDLLSLAGAWMAAGYLLIGRRIRVRMSLIPYIFLVYGVAALTLLGIMLIARQTPLGFPPRTYLWLVLLALVPQIIGHSSFNWALRYLSAAFVAISLLGEPIGSTILAYFLLQETPAPLKIFGAILILAGIYIASRAEQAQIDS